MRARRAKQWIVAGTLPVAAASCFLSVDVDELAGGSPDDATAAMDSNDASTNDQTVSDGRLDGGAGSDGAETDEDGSTADARVEDATVDAPTPCPDGVLILGATAFDVGIANAVVCAPQNALVDDGNVVGLDRVKGSEGVLDGKSVTGCVGIDFGKLAHLTAARVHVGPVSDACGASPCVMNDAGCQTGHTFSVFAGTRAALKRVDVVFDANANAPYVVKLEAGGRDVSAVVVCREGWGTERDDLAVDFIAGVCE